MKHNITILILACLLSSCVVVQERKADHEQAVRCEVSVVQSTTSLSRYTYMATVQAEAHIPLTLPYGGTITEISVKPNTRVSRGEPLLRVDDSQARQTLAAARASLAQAQDALARTTPMHDKGLITDVQMVDLRTKLEQAQAAVTAAERRLQQCTLTAPQDGLITYSNIHVGQHLAPELTAMTLLDMSGFTALVHVPETEVAALHTGDQAQLTVPAIQTADLSARLTQIGVQASGLTHTYPVEAMISDPPQALLPGMVGTLTILQNEQAAIIIPQRCVTLLSEGAAVWVVNDNDRAERRPVALGTYQADGVQVLSGLNAGDRLVTSGYQKLYHNAPVQY